MEDRNLEERAAQDANKKTVVNKMVLLGDVFVGKTSIAYRFVKNEFTDFQESTVGAVFLTHAINVDDTSVKFDIWDTAGQERYRALAPMYYKGARAALIVYDITASVKKSLPFKCQETFKKAKDWVHELHQNAGAQIVIGFVGNKIDLSDKRQVTSQEVKEYCDKNGLYHFEVSAKTGENLAQMFLELAKKLPTNQAPKKSDNFSKLDQKKDVQNNNGSGCGC